MSRQRITLKPLGAIQRDTALKLQMQKIVVSTPVAPTPECTLSIATLSPVEVGSESFLAIFTSQVQTADLAVIVSALAGSPAPIKFLSGSPPVYDALTVDVIIPAGSNNVAVPFLVSAHLADPVPIVAGTEHCGSAAITLEIDCTTRIDDIFYTIKWDTLNTVAPDGSAGRALGVGIYDYSPAEEDFGDIPDTPSTIIDANAMTINLGLNPFALANPYITPRLSNIRIDALIVGRVCDADTVTWEISSLVAASIDPSSILDASLQPRFGASIFGLRYETGLSIDAGQVFTIQALLNGVLIDHPRATFTINIAP